MSTKESTQPIEKVRLRKPNELSDHHACQQAVVAIRRRVEKDYNESEASPDSSNRLLVGRLLWHG